jgi:hypothetical protein
MRRFYISAFLALSLAAPVAARAQQVSDASASLFAERTALLAIDQKCALLASPVRAALSATTVQARSGAFRDGWTDARLDDVSIRAAQAGRTRDCRDPLVTASAQRAQSGFLGWAKMFSLSLPGAASSWTARRMPDLQGWVLWQDSAAARFGLRKIADGPAQIALSAPLTTLGAPGSAQIYFRDAARAPRPFVGIPGVITGAGLAATAAPHSMAASFLASAVRIERDDKTPAHIVVTFPAGVLAQMGGLDPRESAEIVLTWQGAPPQRIYIEIGDLAVARAFMAARAL